MADRTKPYNGAPRLGDGPGEPGAPSGDTSASKGFGGAPTVGPSINRGEKSVAWNPKDVFPEPYGGPPIEKRPNPKPASGSGDKTGGGDGGTAVIP